MINQDCRYIVIGAYGGVGRQLVEQLHDQGAQLFIIGRDEAKLQAVAESVSADYAAADATDFDAMSSAFQQAKQSLGEVTGVVCCVGSLMLKPAHLSTEKDWHDTIGKNLTAAFTCVQGASQLLMKQGGSVVLISSAAAQAGIPNHEAIAAAKAGIEGLTRSAAATYATNNIRYNAVAPGLVQTPLTQMITKSESTKQFSTAMHALGRLGEPKDIANAITWLLDPDNDWITGQVIAVDGGLSKVRPQVKAR